MSICSQRCHCVVGVLGIVGMVLLVGKGFAGNIWVEGGIGHQLVAELGAEMIVEGVRLFTFGLRDIEEHPPISADHGGFPDLRNCTYY